MKRKRKPDLLAVLAFVVGLGVLASSLAQGMLNTDTRTALAQQDVQQTAFTSLQTGFSRQP